MYANRQKQHPETQDMEDRACATGETLPDGKPGEGPLPSGAFASEGDFVTGCAVGVAILAWAYLYFKADWHWFASSAPSLIILAAAVARLIFQIRRAR